MHDDDVNQSVIKDRRFSGARGAADGWKERWEVASPAGRVGATVAAVLLLVLFVRFIAPLVVGAIGVGVLLLLFFVPYWAPTIVGFIRKHPDKLAIAAVNGFFGWTVIGWVISLIWALGAGHSQQQVVVNNLITQNHDLKTAGRDAALLGTPQLGDIMNGHRFNGATWQLLDSGNPAPVRPLLPPPPGNDGTRGHGS